jgi:hypothetical protein
MRRVVIGVAILVAGEARAADDTTMSCTPARAMIVLDKSSSMVTGSIDGVPKWDIAVDALDDVLRVHETRAEIGLMLFPSAGECSPGQIDVPPQLGQRANIMAALAEPPPDAGNWTPMSQTLDAARDMPVFSDPMRKRYVILVTDGWQWCSPYDPETRLDPVASVQRLTERGIVTYVVGLGDSVDPIALNQMAVEAGTALTGCDPSGDTPTAESPCYYRADSANQLVFALDEIALALSNETCDGVDNDCNGTIDDGCACPSGMTRSCGTTMGLCAGDTQKCENGSWSDCADAITPVGEVCNGDDDDCDGSTDEDGVCGLDEPEPPAPTDPATGEGVGGGCQCDASAKGAIPGPGFAVITILGGLALLVGRRRK